MWSSLPHLFTSGEEAGQSSFSVSVTGQLRKAASEQGEGAGGQHLLAMLPDLLKQGEGDWSLERLERTLINAAVDKAGGNLSAAARTLGLTRPQLAYRLKRIVEAVAP